MSEPKKHVDSLAEGLWQRPDEVTGRAPFSGFRKRRRVRGAEENIQGMVRYMRRRLDVGQGAWRRWARSMRGERP